MTVAIIRRNNFRCCSSTLYAISSGSILRSLFANLFAAKSIAFHPTFQVLRIRRSFSTHGKKEAHPTEMQAQLGHSDIRTTLDIYTQITDPEVARMVNQVTNRIPGLGRSLSRAQLNEMGGEVRSQQLA